MEENIISKSRKERPTLDRLLNHLVNISSSRAEFLYGQDYFKVNATVDGVEYNIINYQGSKINKFLKLKDRLLKESVKNLDGKYIFTHIYNDVREEFRFNQLRGQEIKFYYTESSQNRLELKRVE